VATQRKRPRAYSSPACYLHELGPAPKVAHRGDIQIKRIYGEPDAADGFRVLVDRLWPRGISKQRAAQQRVTLLYAAHDPRRNHAVVLRNVLRKP